MKKIISAEARSSQEIHKQIKNRKRVYYILDYYSQFNSRHCHHKKKQRKVTGALN